MSKENYCTKFYFNLEISNKIFLNCTKMVQFRKIGGKNPITRVSGPGLNSIRGLEGGKSLSGGLQLALDNQVGNGNNYWAVH